MTGDKEKAKTYFSQTIDPKSDEVTAKKDELPIYYIQYANILNELGYFIEATEIIERGRAIWPDNKSLTLTELKIYQDAGKINELANKLKTALETDPNNLNLNATYAGTLDMIAKSYSDKADTTNFNKYLNLSAAAYKVAIEITKKYKDEVKYRIGGKATSYEVTYVNENGEKKKEVVVAGWEYPFTAKEGMNLTIIAAGKEKKIEVTATILLAGNILKEGISDPNKNSIASAAATITKEEIEKNNNLYDLYYNLGVLYFNPGVDVYNVWANTSDEKELVKLEKKYMDYFEKALPYIEEAHNLRPTEKTTMQVLLNIYLRKKDNEKAKKIQEEIKSLNQKK
jgi:tetratricopeptide (TPR) repeat protein